MRNKIILFLTIIALLFTSVGCKKWNSNRKANKRARELKQKEKEKEKEKLKAYQEAVKRHAEIQDKKTRKDMKRRYKKARRYNTGQKEFFLKRWFRGKRKVKQNKGGSS